MIIDRYTKFILTVIAVALMLSVINPWIEPTKVYAELGMSDYSMLDRGLSGISAAIDGIKCSR